MAFTNCTDSGCDSGGSELSIYRDHITHTTGHAATTGYNSKYKRNTKVDDSIAVHTVSKINDSA